MSEEGTGLDKGSKMIYQLQATEYETVRSLFKEVDWHLSTCALLDGAVSGTIYVDHPVQPSAAVAWIGHRFYVVGSHRNDGFNADLRRLFAETVYPWAQEAGQRVFVLYYFSDRWERVIEEILRDRHPMKDQRQYYVFRELQNDWRELIRPGFTLRPVDGDLLEGKGPTLSGKGRPLRNLDRLAQEVLSEEPSVEAYLRNRFGFCLIKGEEIVGWCLSEYNGRDRCEVGIETVEGYRR